MVKDFDEGALPVERALGVKFNVDKDSFVFRVSPLKVGEKVKTRRQVLSLVASTYDPVGLLSPIILEGKKCLQRYCSSKYGWDDPIPEDELSPFLQ